MRLLREQDRRVERAQRDVHLVASRVERVGEGPLVDGVGREQAAEEHDLGDQEQPHPQLRGLTLLLEVVEVVGERAVVRGRRRALRQASWASSSVFTRV